MGMMDNRYRRAIGVFFGLLVLLAPTAVAQVPPPAQIERELATIYRARAPQPSLGHQDPLIDRLELLLMQQARHLAATLRPWPGDGRAKYLPPVPGAAHDPRPSAHLANGLAVLVRSADAGAFPDDYPRDAARDDAVAVLRFLAATHHSGGKMLDDGLQWHDGPQSALSAHRAGQAAWLLWDDLDPELRWLVARMICDEADRFNRQYPPTRVERDTRAEENSWNSQSVALAYNMFPDNPRHADWRETANRWVVSSFATARDLTSDQSVDGRPVREWLTGANLHDDYTLENHDRVHPGYMRAIRTNLFLRLMYEWAGNPVPDALAFNTRQIYGVMKRLDYADGGQFFPNGQDWGLRSLPEMLDTHAMAAVQFDDPQAARLMRNTLDTYERMLAREPGTLHVSEEEANEGMPYSLLDWGAMASLLMRTHGVGPSPAPEAQVWRDLAGLHVFADGKFAVLRTPRTIASFSWGRQVMGLALPFQKDLLLAPNERSMIGSIDLPGGADLLGGGADQPEVGEVKVCDVPGGFAVAGVVSRAGGAIEQRFGFATLADGRTVYVDVLRATDGELPATLDLGTIAVLNDPRWVYHDGDRDLHHAGGTEVFRAADAEGAAPVTLDSPWYNVDDELGIVRLATDGPQVYHPRPTGARGRLEQLFHLNHVEGERLQDRRAGDVLARTALAFYPARTADETREAAGRCRLEPAQRPDLFQLTLEDGTTVRVDLDALTIRAEAP